MLEKLYLWLAGGLAAGAVISLCLWYLLMPYINTYVYNRPNMEQAITASIIENSINNPDIQNILKTQVLLYLKSPEGKAKLAEMLKSPEMTKAMSENIQSPEVRNAIFQLVQVPEFRKAMLDSIKTTPEGRILSALAASIILDNSSQHDMSTPKTR